MRPCRQRSGVDGEEPGRSSSGMNPMYRGSSAAVAGAEAMSSSSSGTSWVERTLSRKTSNPFLMSIGDGKLLPRGENMRVGEEKLDDRQGVRHCMQTLPSAVLADWSDSL